MTSGRHGQGGETKTEGMIYREQASEFWRESLKEDRGRPEWHEDPMESAQIFRRERLLVIEDDLAMSEWLLKELRRAGYVALLAMTGRDGVVVIQSGVVHIVVSDMDICDLPGLDLLHEIGGVKPAPKTILITSYRSHRLVLSAVKQGAKAVLCKPFRMKDLLTALARASYVRVAPDPDLRLQHAQ